MAHERRVDERITVDKLPDCLKVVSFKLGLFEEYTADTVNASKFGMCFIASGLNTMDVSSGQELTLIISQYNYRLKSKVVYAINDGDNKLKFGINFYNGYPIEKYHELINKS
jgi:hypothetical protein